MAGTSNVPKDPTAAERSRRYRVRKQEERHASVPVKRDSATVTAARLALPAIDRDASVTPTVTAAPVTVSTARSTWLVVTVFLLGLIASAVGLYLNASFLWSFGRTWDAGTVLAVIGLVTDAITVVLPCVTVGLWARQRYVLTVTALAIYLLAVTMTALTSLGFASTNIGEAVAERDAVIYKRASLLEDIERLKRERASLPPFTPTSEQAVTAATVARDQECGRVGDNCRRRVAELTAVLQAKALTDRAGEIDDRIAALSTKLASLKPIVSADPQVAAAVAIVAWLSRGVVTPVASDVEMVRLLGIVLMPILGGFLIAFATGLAQPVARWSRRSGG